MYMETKMQHCTAPTRLQVMNRISKSHDWRAVLKRGLDLFFSGLLLLFSLPLIVVVAVLIKLTSPGPVLFVQARVGYRERTFRMYKFRTMIEGAEERLKYLECLN